MTRAIGLTLVLVALAAALPAAAQDSGGLHLRSNPLATLNQIDADTSHGCALSSTSVTVGVNKAFGTGSSATQGLSTFAGSPSKSGCRPLVSTQAAVGVNLGLGSGSQAAQSINVQGQRGALDTISFTRGVNIGVGAGSVASQRILNQFNR